MRSFCGSVVAALLVVTGLTAQAPTDTSSIPLHRLPAAPARTECRSGQPVTVLRDGVLDHYVAELLVHESVHVRQLLPDSTGTCETKLARIHADPDLELIVEIEAYCAQMTFVVRRDGGDPLPLWQEMLRQMYHLAGGTRKPGDIVDVMKRFCPPIPYLTP